MRFAARGGRAVRTAGKVGAKGCEIPQGGPPPASNAGAAPASAAPAWGSWVPMPVRAQAEGARKRRARGLPRWGPRQSKVGILARTTIREAVRRKIVLMAALAGAAFLLLYGLAFSMARDKPGNIVNAASRLVERQAAGMFLLLGLYAANLLVGTIAILASIDALSGDIASGAIQTLLSKPVARWQLFAGKWCGFAALLTAFLLVLEGGVMAVVWSFTRYTAPHAFAGLALLWLEMAVLLTITLLWGTRFSTLANGVLSLGLFGLAFLGGWIEQIGALTHHPHAVDMGIAASLLMPSEALWHRAAFEMQSPLLNALTIGVNPISGVSIPSPAMVVYAAAYVGIAFAVALRLFNTRDL